MENPTEAQRVLLDAAADLRALSPEPFTSGLIDIFATWLEQRAAKMSR